MKQRLIFRTYNLLAICTKIKSSSQIGSKFVWFRITLMIMCNFNRTIFKVISIQKTNFLYSCWFVYVFEFFVTLKCEAVFEYTAWLPKPIIPRQTLCYVRKPKYIQSTKLFNCSEKLITSCYILDISNLSRVYYKDEMFSFKTT